MDALYSPDQAQRSGTTSGRSALAARLVQRPAELLGESLAGLRRGNVRAGKLLRFQSFGERFQRDRHVTMIVAAGASPRASARGYESLFRRLHQTITA